VLLTL
jgi:excisionase family DNA binding protein